MKKFSAKVAKDTQRSQSAFGKHFRRPPIVRVLGVLCATFASSALTLPASAATKPYPIVKVYSDGDAFWDHGTFDESAKRLYLGRENGITTIDAATGKLTEQLLTGTQVHKIVLIPGNRAIATEGGAADAIVFERGSGKIVTKIPTGKKPDAATLDPVTNT